MRRLGRALGVEAMSVYNHVPDKGAILDGICELMLAEIAPAPNGIDWRGQARHYGREFRRVGRRHPNAVGLFSSRPIGAYSAARQMSEAMLSGLGAAGFSPDAAIRAYRTLVRHTLGFTLAEVASAEQRTSVEAQRSGEDGTLSGRMIAAIRGDDQDDLFDFGLEALLDGLELRVAGMVDDRGRVRPRT